MSTARRVKDALSWIHRITSRLRSRPAADAKDIFIFCYHRINSKERAPLGVDLDVFRAQLELFMSSGTLLSPEDFFAFLRGERALPAATNFLITFDDGYVSTVELALPVLNEARARAISFIASGCLGGHIRGPVDARSRFPERTVRLDEIKATQSVFLYQSHGHGHIDFDGERATVLDDLSTSLGWFERELGYRPVAIAYPFGHAPRWPGWKDDLTRSGILAGFVVGSHAWRIRDGASAADARLCLPRVGYLTDETLAHTRARLTHGLTQLRALDSLRLRRARPGREP